MEFNDEVSFALEMSLRVLMEMNRSFSGCATGGVKIIQMQRRCSNAINITGKMARILILRHTISTSDIFNGHALRMNRRRVGG